MSEIEFLRDGIDPMRRCTRCGVVVAYEGRDVHRKWHENLTGLTQSLAVVAKANDEQVRSLAAAIEVFADTMTGGQP